MINLKEMNLEELKELQKKVAEEIQNRQSEQELVLYYHNCKESANYHKRKYKHWSKLLTSVDTSKTNGYAFEGRFLSIESEHKIHMGSLVVEVCGTDITLYRVTSDGKQELATAKTKSMSGLIERAAQELHSA